MAKYGITHVLVDRFHYKSYRYATLGDAIAQAKRDMPSWTAILLDTGPIRTLTVDNQPKIQESTVAKSQRKSNREIRKPKKLAPPKPNASKPSLKGSTPPKSEKD